MTISYNSFITSTNSLSVEIVKLCEPVATLASTPTISTSTPARRKISIGVIASISSNPVVNTMAALFI